jgi:hypothetical protein
LVVPGAVAIGDDPATQIAFEREARKKPALGEGR